jgi:hypothetical protein
VVAAARPQTPASSCNEGMLERPRSGLAVPTQTPLEVGRMLGLVACLVVPDLSGPGVVCDGGE